MVGVDFKKENGETVAVIKKEILPSYSLEELQEYIKWLQNVEAEMRQQ